jgi:hypothetical protein
MSTAGVFSDIEKAFDITWHPGLLRVYKLSELEFPTNLIKLISSFLSQRKFRVSVEGQMSTAREMQAGVPQGFVLSPTLFYINDTPRTPGVNLALFANDTCLYATERKEAYVIRKLQRGLDEIETWCERWNIKINEDKTQAIYFSHRIRTPESLLTLNGRNIPFVNNVNISV